MLITQFQKKEELNLCFHNNPLVELVASLHVLSDPDHHQHCANWVIHTNSQIGKALRNEINYFAANFSQWIFVMDIVTGIACDLFRTEEENGQGKFNYCFEQLELMSDLEFAYLFLGLGALKISRDTLQGWICDPENITEEELEPILTFIEKNNILLFLKNIKTFRKRLETTILQYWEKSFKLNWSSIRTYIASVISQQQSHAKGAGIDYILGMHNYIEHARGKLILHKEIKYEMPVSEIHKVHIFPSVFTAPHLMMDIRDRDLILYYNLDFFSVTMSEPVPEMLLEQAKALSDESRIKILKILWEESSTTQRLSKILNLAPSTISVHLKLLKKADLVKSKPVKKYVFYEINKENLENFWPQLLQYFLS